MLGKATGIIIIHELTGSSPVKMPELNSNVFTRQFKCDMTLETHLQIYKGEPQEEIVLSEIKTDCSLQFDVGSRILAYAKINKQTQAWYLPSCGRSKVLTPENDGIAYEIYDLPEDKYIITPEIPPGLKVRFSITYGYGFSNPIGNLLAGKEEYPVAVNLHANR